MQENRRPRLLRLENVNILGFIDRLVSLAVLLGLAILVGSAIFGDVAVRAQDSGFGSFSQPTRRAAVTDG